LTGIVISRPFVKLLLLVVLSIASGLDVLIDTSLSINLQVKTEPSSIGISNILVVILSIDSV